VTQKGAKIKRYTARGQLQPRFSVCAPDFLRDHSNRPHRTVALELIQKTARPSESDMLEGVDFERVLIDQMILFDRDAL